jgi:hypothetical protein
MCTDCPSGYMSSSIYEVDTEENACTQTYPCSDGCPADHWCSWGWCYPCPEG